MLILAFDTSGKGGSVALLRRSEVLVELTLDPLERSAKTLAPAIALMLAEQGILAGEIGLVATTVGPGSFTGLRIGVTTAKTFAYAVGAEVMGVSTLEAIACQAGIPVPNEGELHAVLDAQRKELFLARFGRADSDVSPPLGGMLPIELPKELTLESLDATCGAIVSAETWLSSLQSGTAVTGSGLKKWMDRIPSGVAVVPAEKWEPRAATVGRLAWRDYSRGRRDDMWKLAPVYLRLSYAEEKAR
jgi:tRNA threonylcarbamoyladenosine biosynthesis protein TsaB